MARLDKKRVIESALALLDEVGMEGSKIGAKAEY